MRAKKNLLFCITFALTFLSLSLAEPRAARRSMQLGERVLAPLGMVQFCVLKPSRCTPRTRSRYVILDKKHRAQLEQVQRSINRAITPGPKGTWASLWTDDATIGDCKDYALSKRARLLALGYPSSALLLAIAIVPDGEFHLVLVVVTDRGKFVLDNLRPAMIRWDKLPYRWVMQSTWENPQFWRLILPRLSTSEMKWVAKMLAVVSCPTCPDAVSAQRPPVPAGETHPK